MKLKDYQFGFADASKEYLRIPQLFSMAFYDPREDLSKLINNHHFLLVGSKGTGKTAFASKIRLLADEGDRLFTVPVLLNDFEYKTFSKTSLDEDLIGTQKFKQSWDLLLLLLVCKTLYNELKIHEVEELNRAIEIAKIAGLSINDDFKQNVKRLSKLKVNTGVDIAVLKANLEAEFDCDVSASYNEILSLLSNILFHGIEEAFLNGRQVIIMVDGVDDVLRFKKSQLEIVSSLVRSIDYVNNKLFEKNKLVKVILLIRTDILSNFVDPDLNKIRMDESITINWGEQIDGLRELVNLRFLFSGVPEEEVSSQWYNIFPPKLRDKDSWDYIWDYTLGKPRDILQFLKICQEIYPEKQCLNFPEVIVALRRYSSTYLLEEMKNELTGFISDNLIRSLSSILQSLGTRSFNYSSFCRTANHHDDIFDAAEVRRLLELLFNAGYIGHLYKKRSPKGDITSVVFKYRNPTCQFDIQEEFITHRGIYNGLGIR